jgi:hypothetical protein
LCNRTLFKFWTTREPMTFSSKIFERETSSLDIFGFGPSFSLCLFVQMPRISFVLTSTPMIILSFDVGIKNLAYCVLDLHPDKKTILAWEVYNVAGGGNPSRDLCLDLAASLDDRASSFKDVSAVLIERQPGKNRKAKSMEAYLHMYFVVKGKRVIVYDASRKLENEAYYEKGSYYQRKKTAIRLAAEFLDKNPQSPEMIRMYTGSRKKDDLSDCLLQALSFEKRQAMVTRVPKPQPVIKARKPTARQLESKKYTRNNIKYLIDHLPTDDIMILDDDPGDGDGDKRKMECLIDTDSVLKKNIHRYWPSINSCLQSLYPPDPPDLKN